MKRLGFWFLSSIMITALIALSAQPTAAVMNPVINEFVANHDDFDMFEYVEIYGTPLTNYSTMTLLEIEGDSGGAGTIDGIFPLGTTDGAGFWDTGFMNNIIENGTVTLLLVDSFTGFLGQDLDVDNDGILDVTPWSLVIDDVAVWDGGGSDHTYASTVLAKGFDGIWFTPGGASRIPDGTDTDTVNDWVRNDFHGEGLPGFDGTPGPGEALNTPGLPNRLVVPDPDPVINEFVADHTGGDTHEFVEIFGDPGANYSSYTIVHVEGDGANAGRIDSYFDVGTVDTDGFWTTGFMGGALENGSMTLLLVENFTGYVGFDIDTDNDGTIDATRWSRLVDDVAILNGDPGDQVYSTTALAADFDGSPFRPGGASRIPNGMDTDTVGDWFRNDYDGYGLPGFLGTPEDHEAINTPGYANDTVADFTPPVITVDLDRTVLWPPNHKMVEVCATVIVTDNRDPAPTFVLTSVSSSEPDNGQGDGNTVNDIQGADVGTADVCFELRAERQGGGNGREYTIVYTAEDEAGNTASMTVAVRVPHDHSGFAMPSAGFLPDGTGLDESTDQFALVIPSRLPRLEMDENRNLVVVQDGYDATEIEVHHVYVGNTRGALRPEEALAEDINGDGLEELVLFYSTADAIALITGTSPDGEKIKRRGPDGPIGMHYESLDGTEFLVSNIFDLGPPVQLVIVTPQTNSGDAKGDSRGAPGIAGPLAYPNPFNPATTIAYTIPETGIVNLRIYDAKGRLVDTLVNDTKSAGEHISTWAGRDASGSPVASGVYFVRLEASGQVQTQKIVLLK
ncbi:MAG: T9SS type A sorting domain-containing protein [Candidatus Latescibacterota bacterium]|nr:MAG: T9SS type A sorting domain-containing protein [Candidatus Latescibacterota bacterium]